MRTRITRLGELKSVQVVTYNQLPWRKATSLQAYMEADHNDPMLHGDPLVRFGLVEGEQGEQIFIWTLHHAVYDSWSLKLLFESFLRLYNGQIGTVEPVAFNSFIKYIQQTDQQGALDFWTKQLDGDLPLGFPTLPAATYQPRPNKEETLSLALPSTNAITLHSSATILRAAWALSLTHVTSSDDAIFAMTLSGRNAPVANVIDMAAPTITTVPIRSRIDTNESIEQYLEQTKEQAVEMMPYEHTGLQNIRDAETGNRIPLDLKHLFVVQPASPSVTTEDNASIMRPPRTKDGEMDIQFGFDSYALVVECHVEGEGDRAVQVAARFDDNVIDHSQIRQLIVLFGHLVTLLSTTTKTSSRLCDLTIAPPGDLAQIMQWNDVNALQPSNDCLHTVVVQWAKSQPDRQAICSWDAELSFRELDSLSSQLAHHLVDNLGLAPEVIVPLYFDKSAWAIVSMLAVLKAGAAYVPLNTAFPIEHNQSIVDTVNAKVVLTSSDHLSLFDNGIVINRSFIESLPSDGSRRLSSSDPSSAAIVVFTSATTGKPKGIILTHSSLSSMMRTQGPLMGFDTSTRTLNFAAASFDVSNSEVLTTLFHGGCICVPSEYDRLNRLSEVTSEYNVNWLFLTPSLANQLDPEAFPSLRHLALGGEAVTQDSVARWASRVRLLNSYGPSEASIWSSMSHLRSDTTTVNIGRGLGCLL